VQNQRRSILKCTNAVRLIVQLFYVTEKDSKESVRNAVGSVLWARRSLGAHLYGCNYTYCSKQRVAYDTGKPRLEFVLELYAETWIRGQAELTK